MSKKIWWCHSITPLSLELENNTIFIDGKSISFWGWKCQHWKKMFCTCPLCMDTLGSWSSCESCIIVDVYDGKCRLYNPCKLHRWYAVQIKDYNLCLENICDFHTRVFLCSYYHYDKCDQWENTYFGMIGKKPKRDFSLILILV